MTIPASAASNAPASAGIGLPDAAARAAHILVVDDVEKNTRLLADLLAVKGYRASTASSGEQALEQIDADPPDLVLLDVMMPGQSGYEVCQALRANPRHALLPVVLVTALDPATERVKGIAAGADDFLSKPINQAELLARVRSLLRVKTLQDEVQRLRAELAVWQNRFGSPVEADSGATGSATDAGSPNLDPGVGHHAEPLP